MALQNRCRENIGRVSASFEETEKAIALHDNNFKYCKKQIQITSYENIGLQCETHAKISRYKDMKILSTILETLETSCGSGKNTGLGNAVVIERKDTFKDSDKQLDYTYYIAHIQRCAVSTKRQWLKEKLPRSEDFVVIDNPNSAQAFNCFKEEGHVEKFKYHFRVIDLTREDLHDMNFLPITE